MAAYTAGVMLFKTQFSVETRPQINHRKQSSCMQTLRFEQKSSLKSLIECFCDNINFHIHF